jgi:hypothetical protein
MSRIDRNIILEDKIDPPRDAIAAKARFKTGAVFKVYESNSPHHSKGSSYTVKKGELNYFQEIHIRTDKEGFVLVYDNPSKAKQNIQLKETIFNKKVTIQALSRRISRLKTEILVRLHNCNCTKPNCIGKEDCDIVIKQDMIQALRKRIHVLEAEILVHIHQCNYSIFKSELDEGRSGSTGCRYRNYSENFWKGEG